MTNEEKTALYLEKVRCYFTDVPKLLKHLEDVVKPDDRESKDPNLLGIKAMCGSLYLCMFYINQISIVASKKDLAALSETIHKVYIEHKPIIDKLNLQVENQTVKEFEEKGLNFVGGNNTLQ